MPPNKPLAMLINPPIYDFALYDLFLKPYGLFRVGCWLEKAGYEVLYINALDTEDPPSVRKLGRPKRRATGTGKFFRQPVPLPEALELERRADFSRRYARYGILRSSLEAQIAQVRPDLVCVASGMTYWYRGVVESVHIVQKLHTGVPIIIGGIYATLMPDHCRAVTGVEEVVTGSDPAELARLLERTGLPLPDSVFPPPSTEKKYWGDAGVIRLNEGCPFQCDYCASHLLCPRFRAGDAGAVYTQFEKLYREGIRNFAFYDDALLADSRNNLHPFLRKVIEGPYSPRFFLPNAVHVHLVTDETAFLMQQAGFQEVRLGFESASEEFHAAYDRKFSMEAFAAAVDVLQSAGFSGRQIGVYILAGLPGQTWEEVDESIRYAVSFGVRVFIAEFSPVPGTSLWEDCVSQADVPLEEEPLFHNNTFFPLQWSGFEEQDLLRLKETVRDHNRTYRY